MSPALNRIRRLKVAASSNHFHIRATQFNRTDNRGRLRAVRSSLSFVFSRTLISPSNDLIGFDAKLLRRSDDVPAPSSGTNPHSVFASPQPKIVVLEWESAQQKSDFQNQLPPRNTLGSDHYKYPAMRLSAVLSLSTDSLPVCDPAKLRPLSSPHLHNQDRFAVSHQ